MTDFVVLVHIVSGICGTFIEAVGDKLNLTYNNKTTKCVCPDLLHYKMRLAGSDFGTRA